MSGLRELAIAMMVLSAACSRVAPTEFGVNLIVSLESLDDETKSALTIFRVVVSGDEAFETTISRSAFDKNEARIRYVPGVASGSLAFAIDGLDGDATLRARAAATSVSLVAGRAATVALTLLRTQRSGESCTSASDCPGSIACVDGVCCDAAACPACRACGATGACDVLVSDMEDLDSCTAPNACDAVAECHPAGSLGAACTSAAECRSGFCTDGVCCDTACDGLCRTCGGTMTVSPGTCGARVMVEEAGCESGPLGASMCDAIGECVQPHVVTSFAAGMTAPEQFTRGPMGRTIFVAEDADGREPWVTDGTAAGTHQILDIRTGSSNPNYLVALGDRVLFTALHEDGFIKLYATDGTAAGTVVVSDFGGQVANPSDLIAFGGHVYFAATVPGSGVELWRTDGTSAGTVVWAEIRMMAGSGGSPQDFHLHGGHLYFSANDGVIGRELWRTDGVTTELALDVYNMGVNSGGPHNLRSTTQGLYFSGLDALGNELWLLTPTGGSRVADLNAGGAHSDPSDMTELGGLVYFAATTAIGRELYFTDGVTITLKRNFAAAADGNVRSLTPFQNEIYFVANDSGDSGGLWKMNAVDTSIVKTLSASSAIDALTPFAGSLFFAGTDGAARRLWISDGTSSGTVAACASPNTCHSPLTPTVVDGRLYFTAEDTPTEYSLWVYP